ncbi:thiol-activated cytolysin family protein [Streptomyces sp. NPDC045456]|uniref:thiol-activated cytolysin family protein n=1 Tax=Streptomyces sp. NPDC045456 TaxID=3155254 RepID=UPI003404DAB3
MSGPDQQAEMSVNFYADESLSVWQQHPGAADGRRPAWAVPGGDGAWTVRWEPSAPADRFVLVDLSGASQQDVGEEIAQAARPGNLAVEGGAGGPVPGRYGVLAYRGEELVDASLLGAGAPDQKVDLWAVLQGWHKWNEISPQDPDGHEQTGDPKELKSQGATGVSTPMKVTRTPDQIITFNPNHSMLWPGALVRSDQARDHGWLVPVGLETRFRAPLAISVDQLSAGGSITVPHPDQASVLDAIKKEVQGKESKSRDVFFNQTAAYSASELALEMGISARYGMFSASVSAAYKRKDAQNCFAVYLRERAFTASVSWNNPNELINDSFTGDALSDLLRHNTMGFNHPPLIVSDITYGRVLTLTLSSTSTESELQAAIKASYEGFLGGGSAELNAHYKKVLSTSSVTAIAQGGDPSLIHTALANGSIAKYFEKKQELENYSVIGYTLKTLTGDPASMSETTSYDQVRWDRPYEAKLWIGQTYQNGHPRAADVTLDDKLFEDVTDSKCAEATRKFSSDGKGDPFYATSEQWQDGATITPASKGWFLNGKTEEKGTLPTDSNEGMTFHFWAKRL